MKKNYTRALCLAMLGATYILCLIGLFNLSGCVISNELPCGTVITWGESEINLDTVEWTINGPDTIEPCDDRVGPYYANWFDTGQQMPGTTWVASGDIQIDGDPNFNPTEVIGTKDGSWGTLSLVTTAREGCPGGKVLASKDIATSFVSTISIKSDLCMDPSTNIGSGKLQLVNKLLLPVLLPAQIEDCVWSVLPAGSAQLTPQPDKVTCLVTNATGDLTVLCEVTNGKCTSTKLLEFKITVARCQP